MDKITILKDGNKCEYDVLFTANDKENNNEYVIYTDNSIDENGNARIYLGRRENDMLVPVSEEEKKLLEEYISIVQKGVCQYAS